MNLENGWQCTNEDDCLFHLHCKACGNTYIGDLSERNIGFDKLEPTMTSIKKETYKFYESVSKYDLYVCSKCCTVIGVKQ